MIPFLPSQEGVGLWTLSSSESAPLRLRFGKKAPALLGYIVRGGAIVRVVMEELSIFSWVFLSTDRMVASVIFIPNLEASSTGRADLSRDAE